MFMSVSADDGGAMLDSILSIKLITPGICFFHLNITQQALCIVMSRFNLSSASCLYFDVGNNCRFN